MYFLKRIPEPKQMGKLEMKVFEQESKKNYQRWMVPLADDVIEVTGLKEGVILDVGCGPGLLTRELARRSKKLQVIGIDVSYYAIKQAKRNCHELNNVTFKIADVSRLPFKDNFFDLVICKDSLHHFGNLKRALREMCRVVKREGTVYLQDLRRDLPWYLLKMVVPPKNPFQKLQYYSARAAYTKKELTNILNGLSFRYYNIRTRKITNRVMHKYKKIGIDINKLRSSFQSRYVAVVKK